MLMLLKGHDSVFWEIEKASLFMNTPWTSVLTYFYASLHKYK